jgi:uncharacterized membrane protein YfcA
MAKSSQPRPSAQPPKSRPGDFFVGANLWALVGNVAWQVAGPILILGIGGALLDQRIHTTPLFLLLGVLLSLAVSYVLVRGTVRRIQAQVDELVRQGVIKP